MLKPNCAWDNHQVRSPQSVVHSKLAASMGRPWTTDYGLWIGVALIAIVGCATPEYALRATPVPEESASALQIEQTISAQQAQEFQRQGARRIGLNERLGGFAIQALADQLSRVTERPSLRYQAYLYQAQDPNAAALADGRIYISTGMIDYLASRGSHVDELAFVLGHELAHTVAQHLVKRYRELQRQQLIMALVQAGAEVAARGQGPIVQQAGQLAVNAASIVQDVHASGYSQQQELEADQLGIRYVLRVGLNPQGALRLLEDFSRLENPSPFLRTHPYTTLRREYLQRYLVETEQLGTPTSQSPQLLPRPAPFAPSPGLQGSEASKRIRNLRETQRLYPKGSVSWNNLQQQIDALEARREGLSGTDKLPAMRRSKELSRP